MLDDRDPGLALWVDLWQDRERLQAEVERLRVQLGAFAGGRACTTCGVPIPEGVQCEPCFKDARAQRRAQRRRERLAAP